MKALSLNCVLLLFLVVGAFPATGSEDVSALPTINSGIGFKSSQSINGVGFTSTRSCLNDQSELLQAHSSGSGFYSHDSTVQLIDLSYSDAANSFSSAGQYIELQENTSFDRSVVEQSIRGLRIGPIKSLWSDSVTTGNSGGVIMSVGFDRTQTLSKELHTKASGITSLETILGSSGTFKTGMKYDVAFNGTGRQDVSFKDIDKKTTTRLIDEQYIGTFKISKNMEITVTKSTLDYGEKSQATNAVNWLPCVCIQEYDGKDMTGLRYHRAKDFFDCNNCGLAKSCAK